MTYPAMTTKQTSDYVAGRRSGKVTGLPEGEQRGDNEDSYYDDVRDVLDDLLADWKASGYEALKSGQDKDGLEGKLAVRLHEEFDAFLPAYVLTDRDFWRFCAAYMFEFVEWRNGEGCKLANYGASGSSIGRECTPHRMFDRAFIAHLGGVANGKTGDDAYAMATFGHTDLWRSHLLRVSHGDAPVVAHELALDVKQNKIATKEVRPLAKHLQRVRANVLFQVLDPHQARVLVDRETTRVLDVDGGHE